MLKARPGKEVVLRVENEVGVLDQIARTVAEKGVDIQAVSAWVEGPLAVIRLVTDDNRRVATEVPHKPGMLRHVTERLARGAVDVHHLYVSTVSEQGESLVVLATANNDRATVLLNT
jgi:hypothetical protein